MNIAEITPHLNLLAIIKQYGHQPTAKNSLLCPFHEDKTPSLIIYPHTNTWHCFGCGKGRDALDFIRLKENCSTSEALEKAQTFLGLSPIAPSPESSTPRVVLSETQRIDTLTQAFTYFARSTKAEAKNYLNSRSLNPAQLSVGFDNQSFHKTKTTDFVTKENYQHVGLLYPDKLGRTGSYHSFFSQCIVFPTLNEQGQIINLYGRCIDDTKTNKHRYLPGKHQGIYPAYPSSQTTQLILTESIIDCATLQSLQHITNTYSLIALYGVNNFTTEIQTAIQQLKHLKEIILFFDGDAAGQAAAAKHSEELNQLCPGVKLSIVNTPENEDINSLSQTYGTNTQAFITELLNQRNPFLLSANTPVKENSEPAKKEQVREQTESQHPFLVSSEQQPIQEIQTPILNTDNLEQLRFITQHLRATIWGGIDYQNTKKLRATLHLQNAANPFLDYRDTIDLYSNANTQRLIREASNQLELGTTIITQTISSLTNALEQHRTNQREKERQRKEQHQKQTEETFNPQQLQAGKNFLQDPQLMEQTQHHLHQIGLVGEEEKGMLLFFILLTRMFKNPLHALVQGKSGSGKTYLLKRIANLIPKAHCKITTALTENTLYHSVAGFWKHKILLIEDLDGALNALLPLREMMSNQSISKFSTEKNLKTGDFEPKFLYVEGPVCVAGATTKDKIYEDNANRSFLIQVNETPEHQENVLAYQRKEIAGLLDTTPKENTQLLFKAAQLHLQPMEVVIPFGEALRIPDYVFKKLRTNAHYLTLIKAIAFWHQAQRPIKKKTDGTPYIEANLNDVEWANKLSKEVLLRKSDELDGAQRAFFENIKTKLKQNGEEHFYAKQLREHFRMHPMQVNRYLRDLEQRGYIKQTGGNRKTGFEYSVNNWDDYTTLKNSINILDKLLQTLKEGQGNNQEKNQNNQKSINK